MTTKQDLRHLLAAVIISFSAATSVFFTSDHLFSRSAHRADTVGMQFALLHGQPYALQGHVYYLAPNQNRVLFPMLLAAASHSTALSIQQWFAVIRFGTAFGLFLLTWYVSRRAFGATDAIAAAAVLLLAYGLTFTFAYPYAGEYTSDFLDGAFTVAFVGLAVRRQRGLLMAIALIAAANRESAPFAGVIWVCLYGFETDWRPNWREIVFAAGVSIAAYAAVIAIRFAFGGAAAVGSTTQVLTGPGEIFRLLARFGRQPQLTGWPTLLAAAVAPPVLWILANVSCLTTALKRLLVAAAAIAAASMQFGMPDELRVLIPSWVLLVLVASASAAPRVQPQAIPTGFEPGSTA